MGTRGTWGYVVNDTLKITYNHFDSYPSELGETVLAHARWCAANLDLARKMAGDLVLIDPEVPPTPEQIEHLKPFTDLNVSERSTSDWYCLTRKCQGDPEATLAAGVMSPSLEFPADSLFCEWGYVIDLDGQRFEMYEGFQRNPHNDGRFATTDPGDNGYYPIRLIQAWPLNALPDGLDDDDEDEGDEDD